MYKLIAIDMDGTLLNEDKKITKENYEAIQEAKRLGKKVVLATGRPLVGVKKYLEYLNLVSEEDYVVAFNGSLVQTTKSGRIISRTTLSLQDYKELYKVSTDLGVNIHALTESRVLTPKINKYTELESSINGIPIKEIPVESIEEDETIVKVMFIDEPELLDKAVSNLPEEITKKYSILRSAPYFLEFLHKSVNKGAGVQSIAEELNIDRKQVICIGDAGNDIAMIQYAGLGVAMGNAFDDVKEVADYITTTNNENGVANVIKKFMIEDNYKEYHNFTVDVNRIIV